MRAIEKLVEGREQLSVSVLRVFCKFLFAGGQVFQKILDFKLGREVLRFFSEAFVFQVAGIEDLFKLACERQTEHRLVQIDALPHERETAACDDCTRRSNIVDKSLLAEGTKSKVPLHPLLRQIATHPIDATFHPRLTQHGFKCVITLARLVDEKVVSPFTLRRQDLRSKNRGKESGRRLSNLGPKKRGDEVLVAVRQL